MTIVAKFPSRCACCGGSIQPGEKIEWKKGEPARHARCAAKPARASTPRERKAPAPQVDVSGCRLLSRRSRERNDNYEVGQVLHAAKVPGGGGQDGHYWTVVRVERKWRDDDTDEWMVACHARPSTPEECAAPDASRQAAEQRKALMVELVRLCESGVRTGDDNASRPVGSELVVDPGVQGSGLRVAVLGADGSVSLWCSGHYDDYRQSLAVTRDPRAAEVFALLVGGAS